MSMKSFDKFCENLILKAPGSEKEIFDERQKIIRSGLTLEALKVFIAVSFANCAVMDFIYKWAETFFSPMILILCLCALYWLIRNGIKGTLTGVNGLYAKRYSAIMLIIIGSLNLVRYAFDLGEGNFIIKDGMITSDFLLMMSFIIVIVCGVTTLVILRVSGDKV